MFNQYKIIVMDYNRKVVKTVRFTGNYDDARKEADKILHSDESYLGCIVEFDW